MTCTPQLQVCDRFRAGGGDWEFTHRAADLQGPTGVGRGTSERRSGGIGAPKGREFMAPSRDRMVDLEIARTLYIYICISVCVCACMCVCVSLCVFTHRYSLVIFLLRLYKVMGFEHVGHCFPIFFPCGWLSSRQDRDRIAWELVGQGTAVSKYVKI